MTAAQYLTAHGITEEFAKQEGLTWDNNELHIPVKDENGEVIFSKHRNLNYNPDSKEPGNNKFRYDSGAKATLFNYDASKLRSYIVATEGEADAIRLKQDNIPSVSSTGGATTFLPEWATLLEHKNIFIAYDNDSAGKAGTIKLLELMPEAKVVNLPDNIKDVCDYFMAGKTKQDFIGLLKTAQTKAEWEQANEPEEFKLISAYELRQMSFDEQPWLIDRIIYKEGFCFIYGGEGTGKSFLTLSIAKAIASGQPWLDQFKVPHASKVLFIDKENPTSLTAKRITGLDIVSDNISWLKYPENMQLVDSKGEFSKFAKSLANKVEAQEISLIIVDSFVDLMVGVENNAEDTQMFFDGLRRLFPKKAILVLHHENKPSAGTFRNDSQRVRGSSNINAQTNTMFRLELVAKSKTEMTFKQTKARDAQKLDKFMIRMVVEDLADNNTRVTGFEYIGIVEEEHESKVEEVNQILDDIFSQTNQASRKEILDNCIANGLSESTTDNTIREMVKSKELEKVKVGRETYYIRKLSVKTENE